MISNVVGFRAGGGSQPLLPSSEARNEDFCLFNIRCCLVYHLIRPRSTYVSCPYLTNVASSHNIIKYFFTDDEKKSVQTSFYGFIFVKGELVSSQDAHA